MFEIFEDSFRFCYCCAVIGGPFPFLFIVGIEEVDMKAASVNRMLK